MAENEINNQRTKHIDIHYHMVRQHIANKTVDLQHVPSKGNVADMLTKALGPEIFNKLCPKLLDLNNQNKRLLLTSTGCIIFFDART